VTSESDAGQQAWRRARTLEDLGELTARWCEGTLRYMPTDAPEPYEETEPIREVLASINRSGLMTTFSQPGEPLDNEGYAQRACVEGYATEATARRLGTLALWTELLMHVFPPSRYQGGYQVPVTIAEFRPFTWVGGYFGQSELEYYAEDLSREALTELSEAWTVTIIDPVWGREDYLWEHVSTVLEGRSPETRFSVEPYDTGLDFDFGV